ncbi:MAG TPA: M56 family metallopeptidase [Candidatus Angelobacter sp.]|nr:M56 family metallopeptidase [Candidatus Angelobacter sp.]
MDLLHATARMSVQWMLYCLMEGTVLAVFTWLLLRLLPRQNAGTRFALWFSVLLAIIVLPFLAGTFFRKPGANSVASPTGVVSGQSLMTLSSSVAVVIFAGWLLFAALALARVVAGLWQVSRIRKNSEEVDPGGLSPEVRESIERFPRPVSLRVSDRMHVPAAIGFFNPAVVIPDWFLQEMSAAELEQVLLHELTHLRRWDDWTNLAQKIIKALLFFHPSVWWVEQRLSLEREMACDDAVLSQSASPQHYAQCLARVAEKTLMQKRMRKKMALAQAVVTRMRQLSLRVAQILDVNRPGTTRLWKPAVPMVLAAATLCGLSAWNIPALVSFKDEGPRSTIAVTDRTPSSVQLPRQVNASLRVTAPQPKLVLAHATMRQPTTLDRPTRSQPTMLARQTSQRDDLELATRQMPGPVAPGDYVVQSEQFVVTMTAEQGRAGDQRWQVQMWQVRIVVPAQDHNSKTVSRKNI